ncbi:FliH/SctL family protein [Candidatus Magnetaquicoccus inordinatus]|uniref:FliH/SctL family protein n=1 Tax=Candidatus Magnetaquicoccus inordinatus TaxID=2496818 RepID=UPI00102B2988|nr:FliH/SctL family protein [Candidatus Magnetaquicoccus inordinatus]
MAVVSDSVIKQEELDVEPQRVSFRDLLADAGAQREKFVHFLPDGSLPGSEQESKPPELSVDELHRRRLEAIERETYQKAFAAGEEAGLALGEQAMEREMSRLLPQFEAVLRQLDGLPKRIFASAERFLLETAITLTRELVAHELTINPEEISHRVQRLLEQAAGRRDIVIYVAPDSAALLQQLPGFEKLRIEADGSVGPGSVRMTSDFGGMEDDLERQLADMEAGIRSFLLDRLLASGNEDIATATTVYASRLAAQGRPLHLPAVKPAAAIQPHAGVAAAPQVPAAAAAAGAARADEGAWRSSAASAVGAVRLEEIAGALAEQERDQEEGWHHPSRSGSSLVGSFLDEEDDASYMEETIVSTALSGRVSASHWAESEAEQDGATALEDGAAVGLEELPLVEEQDFVSGGEEQDAVDGGPDGLKASAGASLAEDEAALAQLAAESLKEDDEVA